jgi:hypothetical protein
MQKAKKTVQILVDLQYKKLMRRTQEFFTEMKEMLDSYFDSGKAKSHLQRKATRRSLGLARLRSDDSPARRERTRTRRETPTPLATQRALICSLPSNEERI